MKKTLLVMAAGLAALVTAPGQRPDFGGDVTRNGGKPAMAVPDMRGAGAAAPLMNAFNGTLWSDLAASGFFKMVPKTSYPLLVPQRPEDVKQTADGLNLITWAQPPVSANVMTIGYAADQNGVLVLSGWLFNTARSTNGGQMLGKRYLGGVDEAGARKVAHEFAADIIGQFGGLSLLGSKIFFVSDRTGTGRKEIFSMDPDGANQQQITRYNSISMMPAVSVDGTKIAFTSYAGGNPAIFIFSVESGRKLPFYNQKASMNATPGFTPDGKQLLYSSTASGWAQIYLANIDGSGLRRISNTRAIEVEPKVNPKTGTEMVFVSGRTGPQQIFKMNLEGASIERLTNGEGEASNPSWHPDGQIIAYSWTRGFSTGAFNIFTMDVATRSYTQLTHGEGRNENPSWAPDGRHIVFMSTRSGSAQIYTMLADGTQVTRLTSHGKNYTPVWGKGF